MNDDYVVTCKKCNAIDPVECNQMDCPMENYFWEREDPQPE